MTNKNQNQPQDEDGTQHIKVASNSTLHRIQEQLADTDCLDTPYGQKVNEEVMERLNNPPKP